MPRRILQLAVGLGLFGIGVSLILRSGLGAASWDVLTQGLGHHVPLSFGTITIITSGLVLLCWIPLKQRVGFGTVANALLVGIFADIGLAVFATPEAFWLRLLQMLLGVLLVGLASGIYIGSGFGSGPRDGLMIGLHTLTGLPIWVVRTGLEVVVVAAGWLLGGTVGIGTVAFALLIGPLCQVFLPLFAIRDAAQQEKVVGAALEAPVVLVEPEYAPIETGSIPLVGGHGSALAELDHERPVPPAGAASDHGAGSGPAADQSSGSAAPVSLP